MSERVEIGDAVLYRGDCLEVMADMLDGSIDMIWTDPPYGHSNHEGDWNARLNEHRGIEGQPIVNDDHDDMRRVVDGMLTAAARVLSPDCCCCCCCGGGGPRPTFAWLAERMDRGGLQFFHSIIWDKKNPGLGWRYRRGHEMIMVAHRPNGRILWHEDRGSVRNIISLSKPRDLLHPNQKPVQLVEWFLDHHVTAGQITMDPFMGGGTTGVACANMGLKFIGIEIEPKYFDIACRRIEKAYDQPDLFIEPPAKAVQEKLDIEP